MLCVLSGAMAFGLVRLGFGAGVLVGPMLVAMAFGLAGGGIEVPRLGFNLAQASTGAVISSAISSSVLATVAASWWQMMLSVAMTVTFAALIGWLLMRRGNLPGTTGTWGTLPGAAPAMIALADEYGGDARMVAVMQYLRVVLVVGSGSIVVHALAGHLSGAMGIVPPMMNLVRHAPQGSDIVATIVVVAIGAYVGMATRILAGAILVPLFLGALLGVSGIAVMAVHDLLLALAFATIGATIGLKFRRDLARPLIRALPTMLLAIVALMLLCGVSAWVLTLIMPIDGVTAYLATTPGGLDSVAVIALGAHADLAFITALQTLRLFAVVVVGPIIARRLSHRHTARISRQAASSL